MKSKTKKFIAFLSGCFFGTLLLGFLIIFEKTLNLFPHLLVGIITFPALIGIKIGDLIIWPICKLNTGDLCRGLPIDGGPLVWIEWTSMYAGLIIGYGLIFLFVYNLYTKIKNK